MRRTGKTDHQENAERDQELRSTVGIVRVGCREGGHDEVWIDGGKNRVDVFQTACVAEDERRDQQYAEDENQSLHQSGPGDRIQTADYGVCCDDNARDDQSLPVFKTEHPHQNDTDCGVLADEIDQTHGNACQCREGTQFFVVFVSDGKIVLKGHAALFPADLVEFGSEEDNTECCCKRYKDLFPDSRPPGGISESACSNQSHSAADGTDDEKSEQPESKTSAGEHVVFGVFDLFRGPYADAEQHHKVHDDQREGYKSTSFT